MLRDEELIGHPLTQAQRDEVMAEAARNWDAVEKRWRERSVQAIANQAAREMARAARGLPPISEAELAFEAECAAERRWSHEK